MDELVPAKTRDAEAPQDEEDLYKDHFRLKPLPQTTLPEKRYLGSLGAIIERDYFPSLAKMRGSDVVDLTQEPALSLTQFHSEVVSEDAARFHQLYQTELDKRQANDRGPRNVFMFNHPGLESAISGGREKGVNPQNTRFEETQKVRTNRPVQKFAFPEEDAREAIAHQLQRKAHPTRHS